MMRRTLRPRVRVVIVDIVIVLYVIGPTPTGATAIRARVATEMTACVNRSPVLQFPMENQLQAK